MVSPIQLLCNLQPFNAETLSPQRIAERRTIPSAYLRDLRVSAMKTKKTINWS
jgi:hypothetical protein